MRQLHVDAEESHGPPDSLVNDALVSVDVGPPVGVGELDELASEEETTANATVERADDLLHL